MAEQQENQITKIIKYSNDSENVLYSLVDLLVERRILYRENILDTLGQFGLTDQNDKQTQDLVNYAFERLHGNKRYQFGFTNLQQFIQPDDKLKILLKNFELDIEELKQIEPQLRERENNIKLKNNNSTIKPVINYGETDDHKQQTNDHNKQQNNKQQNNKINPDFLITASYQLLKSTYDDPNTSEILKQDIPMYFSEACAKSRLDINIPLSVMERLSFSTEIVHKIYTKNSKTLKGISGLQPILSKTDYKYLEKLLNVHNEEEDDDNKNNKLNEKNEFTIYKYSKLGKAPLQEAVIVNGLPFFLKYNNQNQNQSFELVEKIEENNRILMPPQEESSYPSSPPYSFESNEELELFMEKAKQVTKDQLFNFSKDIFCKYVDQDNHIITLLAADSIWTYFQDLFPATHYSEGVGNNDVGKSSLGYTFEHTGYRVIKGTVISGANYNRVLGCIEPGQCVIIEDEGDNISEDAEKVKILKAGYEYNNRVPKINMNTTNQEQNWYFPFCYKIILAEKSLKEYKAKGLVDRTFPFRCRPGNVKYSIKEVVSRNLNKSPKLQKLYDELLNFRKLMLCYRLIHYRDLLPEIETGLKNRDEELCKPLLQLFYGTEVLDKEIIPTLETFVKQRRIRKANSLEATLYSLIKKCVFANAGLLNSYTELKEKNIKTVKVSFSEIWNSIKGIGGIEGTYDSNKPYQYETSEYGILYNNTLPTTIADKFTAIKERKSHGVSLTFNIEKLERFEDVYGENQLKEENVKIKVVKVKEEEEYNSEDSNEFNDFLAT